MDPGPRVDRWLIDRMALHCRRNAWNGRVDLGHDLCWLPWSLGMLMDRTLIVVVVAIVMVAGVVRGVAVLRAALTVAVLTSRPDEVQNALATGEDREWIQRLQQGRASLAISMRALAAEGVPTTSAWVLGPVDRLGRDWHNRRPRLVVGSLQTWIVGMAIVLGQCRASE